MTGQEEEQREETGARFELKLFWYLVLAANILRCGGKKEEEAKSNKLLTKNLKGKAAKGSRGEGEVERGTCFIEVLRENLQTHCDVAVAC